MPVTRYISVNIDGEGTLSLDEKGNVFFYYLEDGGSRNGIHFHHLHVRLSLFSGRFA